MKEEILRINRLVAEGKLTPEDGAELIEAFVAAEKAETQSTPPPPPPSKDPFTSAFEKVEKVAKENLGKVDWKDISEQVEQGAKKGFEAIKGSFEDLTKGKVNFGLFGNEEKRDVSLPLTIGEGKRLRIENPCGDVKVLGRAESGTVLAEARIRGGTPEEAKARAQEYTVIVEESDAMVTIRQPDVSGLSVDLTVRLPEAVSIEIRTEMGDVQVTDNAAGVRINTRAGDVKLKGIVGPVEVSADSGNAILEDVESPSVALETKSGDLAMRAIKGNVNARTAAGDISLKESAGKVVALESVSGNVRVDLVEPVTQSLNVRTVNGNVEIDVPDGSDCRVSLSSLRGDVSSGIELEDEAKAEGRRTGRLGAGTGSLDVSAVTGDVKLRLRSTTAV
ncbi:hypothetical protein EON82_15265 [bacterium]|nr:MAG: hypothetical protein EON82_15265 [bacterium]